MQHNFPKNGRISRILGIDPGLATTGFAILEVKNSEIELKDFGVFLTRKGDPLAERLHQISKDVAEICDTWNPHVLSIEKLIFVKNVTNGLLVTQARGIILENAVARGMQILEFMPTEVKANITGNGRAPKIQMQKMVQKILHLAEAPTPDDAADAIAIALCGAGKEK
ncbi:crossover junction endodeoxyribonuclease RuvC [Candidatus Peregrinibacteria bacterium]|nr:crossover junction endodeoxyribonuclease RuvC [Candidatus Peregrinibacteria bacterium]